MDISIIVPVVERYDDLRKLYSEFSSAFDKLDKSYEFIFVVDGQFCEAFEDLKKLKTENSSIKILRFHFPKALSGKSKEKIRISPMEYKTANEL